MQLVDRFAVSDNLYSIVVAGNMNPAIHHPRWYKDVGILDEKEVKEAEEPPPARSDTPDAVDITGGPLVVSTYAAQFTTRAIRIVCAPQSWSVLTEDENKLDKCLSVASQIFQKLDSTPVSAYGFNFNHHRQTNMPSVSHHLAELARSQPLGLTDLFGLPKSARIFYSASIDGRESNTTIEPSFKDPSKVFIGMNFNHPVQQTQGFFDLDLMLKRDYPRAHDLSGRFLESILEALNRK